MNEKYISNLPQFSVEYHRIDTENPVRDFYDSMSLEEKRKLEIEIIKAEKPRLPEITIDDAAAA